MNFTCLVSNPNKNCCLNVFIISDYNYKKSLNLIRVLNSTVVCAGKHNFFQKKIGLYLFKTSLMKKIDLKYSYSIEYRILAKLVSNSSLLFSSSFWLYKIYNTRFNFLFAAGTAWNCIVATVSVTFHHSSRLFVFAFFSKSALQLHINYITNKILSTIVCNSLRLCFLSNLQ